MSISRRQILRHGIVGMAAVGYGGVAAPALSGAALPKPPVLGNPLAPKRLVVWGSYTCPFTAQLFNVVSDILRDMPDAASVEWRHFATHAPDPALHVAGMGFAGDHFWGFTFKVLGAVLAAQGDHAVLTSARLLDFAKAEGGSEETLKAAYADKAKWTAVRQDMLAGQLLGVVRTPGLFYNGYFMTPEGLPVNTATFDKSLRAMLKAG